MSRGREPSSNSEASRAASAARHITGDNLFLLPPLLWFRP